MDRRQFLKYSGFITVSTATLGLSACGGGGETAPVTPPTPPAPPATGANWLFPQSVASGDPRADSVMLWTRAIPATLDVAAAVPSAPDTAIRLVFTNAALSGTALVDTTVTLQSQFDNTIRHKVTGLSASKVYFYQFIAGDVRSNIGRCKTAPAATDDVA